MKEKEIVKKQSQNKNKFTNQKEIAKKQFQKFFQEKKKLQFSKKNKILKYPTKPKKEEIIEKKVKKRPLPLIRNCWVSSIYKKKEKTFLCKERFVNFLTKEGKKSKAYKILNNTGILTRKKLLQFEKKYQFFENQTEVIQAIINSQKNLKNKLSSKPTTKTNQGVIMRNNRVKQSKDSSRHYEMKVLSTSKHEELNPVSFGQLLQQAIENVKPSFEVRKVRVGGTTYLVPSILRKKRQETLAIKWLIDSARIRKGKFSISFAESLSHELLDAFKKQGQARQKRDELHKLAAMNRAYTRYRWW